MGGPQRLKCSYGQERIDQAGRLLDLGSQACAGLLDDFKVNFRPSAWHTFKRVETL